MYFIIKHSIKLDIKHIRMSGLSAVPFRTLAFKYMLFGLTKYSLQTAYLSAKYSFWVTYSQAKHPFLHQTAGFVARYESVSLCNLSTPHSPG